MALDLLRFIDDGPCPSFAADALVQRLRSGGFSDIDPRSQHWDLDRGRYMIQRGGTVIAWIQRSRKLKTFRVIGAHSDSPHLRLKPNAAYACEGCLQLGVEVYGGALINSWLDRDLGLAGRIATSDGTLHPLRIHRPLARVAQLAIHLDRRINDDGLKLNQQLHLAPLWGLARDSDPAEEFLSVLAEATGVRPADIVGHDLSLYDLTPALTGGVRDELIFAPRLDNLASCHAGLSALLAAGDGDDGCVPMLACFDHEEVGSTSASGADGPLLNQVMERIAQAAGLDHPALMSVLQTSILCSADMAHAVHPNYPERHEPRHRPQLGAGPVLKNNVNQRYATGIVGIAYANRLAAAARVPLQNFVARSDLGCGSTIGPGIAASLGLEVIDLGAPMLSMHSARECAAVADQGPYARLLSEHLR